MKEILRPIGIGAVIGALLWGALALHDARVTEQALATDRIARRDQDIARKDRVIAANDRRIRVLLSRDTAAQQLARRQAAELAVAKADFAERSAALGRDMRPSIPIAEVRLLQSSGAIAIASCEQLGLTKDLRIGSLEATIRLQAANRHAGDSTRAQLDSTRQDLVTLLRPRWWHRTLSWLGDHAVTVTIAGGIGYIAGAASAAKARR